MDDIKEKLQKYDIMEKLESPPVRWTLVFVGVVILLRWRLVLFAAALPVMAYWHFSQQPSEEEKEQQPDGEFDNEPLAESRNAKQQDRFDDEDDLDDGFGRDEDPPKTGEDPYGESFWGGDAPRQTNADSGLGADRKAPTGSSWDDDPSGGPLDDNDIIPGLSGMMGGLDSDFLSNFGKEDTFGLGGIGDMDFLSESMGSGFGRGGGKGKGKGKKGDFGKDGGKGDKGPRENDPKQLFVAGVADASEDDLREFFEEKGQVSRLKILRDGDGASKGVCFVTFATEEQAQDALALHGSMLPGGTRGITVRPAGQTQNKGDKGGKGDNKGGGFRDRPPRRDDQDGEPPMPFERNERFGGLGDDRDSRPKGGGKGKGGGGQRRNERSELDELIEEELEGGDGPLRVGDFDYASKRFLGELRKRDRSDGTDRFHEALRHVTQFTASKEREAVRKWTAYVYKLLCTFDQELSDSLRSRDSERKGGGGGGFNREDRGDRPGGFRSEDRDR